MTETTTILLVEDDASILDGMADLLQIFDIGYEANVLKATNGEEGLVVMEQETPDLIISDIMMPKLNGFEFLARVRENPDWVHIPFIFLTAKGKKQDIMEGRRSGAELYITKPFVSTELLELVKSQLERTFQLRRARQQKLGTLKRNILQLLNHEFRTPLTYVTAYYDMLADSIVNVEEPDNLQDYLRGIQVGCVRLTELVEDLIKIMEIRTNKAAQNFKEQARPIHDVGSLFRSRGEALAMRVDQSKISIDFDIESDLPSVYGDPGGISDAIDRLLDNALKFTRVKDQEPQQIRLSAYADNDQVHLCVEDTGIGFPAHVQKQLFDLFYQHNRERLEQQGSGAGLAIAKGLIDLHNGHIEVESEVDHGSKFTIVLPQYEPGLSPAIPRDERPRTATVLLVEDDRNLLDGLQELMEVADCPYELQVLTAANGQEGLEVLERHQPDLIVSDVMMPVMGGYEFLEHVRTNAAWLQIPFIFLTAKGEHEDIHRGRRSGAEEYITKPYNIDELMDLVVTQLDRYFQRQGAINQNFEVLKRSILGMLQPDFKDPLDLVTNYSVKLAQDLESVETDEDLVNSLEGIQANSARLTRLVEDFIAVAEFKTGEAEAAFRMHAEAVQDVTVLLYEATYAKQFAASERGIEFRYDLDHELPPVYCNREQLHDTFDRLLTLVLDHASPKEDAHIQLAATGDEQQVTVFIRAVGFEFPENWAQRIEDSLQQDEEEALEVSGVGPSLTVVKQVLNLHQGDISSQQPADDEIVFELTLPAHQPEAVSMS